MIFLIIIHIFCCFMKLKIFAYFKIQLKIIKLQQLSFLLNLQFIFNNLSNIISMIILLHFTFSFQIINYFIFTSFFYQLHIIKNKIFSLGNIGIEENILFSLRIRDNESLTTNYSKILDLINKSQNKSYNNIFTSSDKNSLIMIKKNR